MLKKIFAIAFISFLTSQNTQASSHELPAGKVPVTFYCQEEAAAIDYLSHFIIVEGPNGFFVHLAKDVAPPLPGGLSQLLLLKKNFKVLAQEEISQLSAEELKSYKDTELKISQLDQFLEFQANKKCFWHHQKYSFMFSVAQNLKWSSEHKLVENDGTMDFKVDIYEAELDFNSYLQKGFIYSKPCRIEFDSAGQMTKCNSF